MALFLTILLWFAVFVGLIWFLSLFYMCLVTIFLLRRMTMRGENKWEL